MQIFNSVCFSAETDPHEGKRKVEALWPIFKIHHQRSRYIYDLFYKRKAISRGTYSRSNVNSIIHCNFFICPQSYTIIA